MSTPSADILHPPCDLANILQLEADYRKYFDENLEGLDPIEGIWSMNEAGTWRNVYSGMTGQRVPQNPYRIAIVRDSTSRNYDFMAVVLESEYPHWLPGRLKGNLRKTAYEKVYDGRWYMGDYSPQQYTYTMDEAGVIRTSDVFYSSTYVEQSVETTFIKAYPPLNGRSLPRGKGGDGAGTGFLLTTKGLVATNYHVVENANAITVNFPDGKSKNAKVKIKDTKNDIAILELESFSSEVSLPAVPFTLADMGSIKVGEEVFAIGFPLGSLMGSTPRLSTGRISSQFGIQDDPRLFQISNPLQPGNSGSPLFNRRGELIGIVVSGLNAKYFYEDQGIIPQNVNFAIKASYLESLISLIPEGEEILKRENRVRQEAMENQVEQLGPFVVQIVVK